MRTIYESNSSPGRLTRIWLTLLAVMIVQPLAGGAEDQTQIPQVPTRIELLYNNVVFTLRSGQVQYGLFIGVEEDALIVKVGSEERHIPRTELARVSLQKPSRRGAFITAGALLGLYSSALFLSDEGYLRLHEEELTYLIYGSLGVAAGGGLGFLTSLFASSEATFVLQEAGGSSAGAWERLRRYAAGVPSARRVHVSVQGGHIFFGPRATYQDISRKVLKGYNEGYDPGGTVNLMRQVRLTVSVSRWFEAGLAGVRISEPSYGAYKYQHSYSGTWPNWTSQSSQQSLTAHFSSTGMFAAFGVRLPQNRQRVLSVTAGFGLGAEKIDFDLITEDWTEKNYVRTTDLRDECSVRKTALAALIYGEASVIIKAGLALGLTGDIVFGPSQEVPPSSALGIAAHKVRFGNSAVGLSLGYHF